MLMEAIHATIVKAVNDNDSNTSPYDAIRDYLYRGVFGHYSSLYTQIYAIIAVSSIILILLAFGTTLRLRYTGFKPILQDGPMSRLDPRFFIPVIWVVYCTFSISLSACLLQAYRREFFNKYGSFMQIFNPTLVGVCGHIIFMNIAANSPCARRFLMPPPSSSFSLRPWLVTLATVVPILALICGITPAAASYARDLERVSSLYHRCMDIIDAAELANSTRQLQEGYPIAVELLQGVDEADNMLAFAGRFNTAFGLFWLFVGGGLYFALDYSIFKRIKQLEAEERDNDSETSSPDKSSPPVFVLPILPPRKISNGSDQFPPVKMPKDSPFNNLDVPSVIPKRYQAVLDTSKHKSNEKAQKLRKLLWRDRSNNACTSVICLGFLSQSIFEAVRGHQRMPGMQALPIFYIWQSWAFLIPGIFVTMLFVLDSIRLAKYSTTPDNEEFFLPFAAVAIGPELPYPVKLKDEDDTVDQSMRHVRGIQVEQTAIITVEEEDPRNLPPPMRRKSFPLLKSGL